MNYDDAVSFYIQCGMDKTDAERLADYACNIVSAAGIYSCNYEVVLRGLRNAYVDGERSTWKK